MASSTLDLTQKLLKAAGILPRALERGVFEAAMYGKTVSVASYVAAGVSKTGSRLGNWSVGFDIKGVANPTALLAVRGRKMHLFENPTRAHTIRPRQRTRRSRDSRTRRAMLMPPAGAGEMRAWANHPGTRGAHVFHGTAVPALAKQSPDIFSRAVRSALLDAALGR